MSDVAVHPEAAGAEHAVAPVGAPITSVRVVESTNHRVRLSEFWSTAPVARMIGVRDMKIKYKQSALGPLWLFIQPLGMLAAISVAFAGVTQVNTGGIPYALFALAGLCVWTYVQLTVTAAPTVFPNNYQVVRRSPCPRVALVTSNLIGQLPPLGVVLIVTVLGVLVSGRVHLQILLLPLVLLWLFAFALALTLLLGSVACRFRDAVALVPLLVQGGIFLSPVGYPISHASGIVAILLQLNPVSGIIEAFRWVLLGADPFLGAILASLVTTSLLLVAGWVIFARLEIRFADYV